MPKTKDQPEKLKPYVVHGVVLTKQGEEASGDCPFCGRPKFSVNIETGVARCWGCPILTEKTDKGGINASSFLRILWELSNENTNLEDYEELANDRNLLPETLRSWGVVESILTGEWLLPGYDVKGVIQQLYRYTKVGGKKRFLATPTIKHKLHGVNLYRKNKPDVFLCEGPWDAMALWQVFRGHKIDDTGRCTAIRGTKGRIIKQCNILATPGCEVFYPSWAKLFGGKEVNIIFDNDHPKQTDTATNTNGVKEPAVLRGMARAVGVLAGSNKPPKQVYYRPWDGRNYHNEDLPDGYDIRDHLDIASSPPDVVADKLTELLRGLVPVPEKWLIEGKQGAHSGDNTGNIVKVEACDNYDKLVLSWRKALQWTSGLDCALSVMLASVASTRSIGDQLWIKIIGPASCGKSTLCEAVSVSKEYVVAKSTIRGFHSGFKTGSDNNEDNSLLSKLYNKTLITKDGDTLLQSPNLGQILSEARDIYDSTSRTHYRNKMGKDYSGIRMTWILCGTASLRSIDSSELGERFLDCVIMEGIDDDLEDEVLWRVANRAYRNTGIESDGSESTTYEEELLRAMQLTGGYVEHIRQNADQLHAIQMPDWVLQHCVKLGKFVAYMRARPSTNQDETSEREFGARLVSQIVKMTKCLAMVMNKDVVDEEVMARTKKVALDTSRGQVLDIMKYLYQGHENGTVYQSIVIYTGFEERATSKLLRFLRRIKVLHVFSSTRGHNRWKMTRRMKKLYEDVMEVKQTPSKQG